MWHDMLVLPVTFHDSKHVLPVMSMDLSKIYIYTSNFSELKATLDH